MVLFSIYWFLAWNLSSLFFLCFFIFPLTFYSWSFYSLLANLLYNRKCLYAFFLFLKSVKWCKTKKTRCINSKPFSLKREVRYIRINLRNNKKLFYLKFSEPPSGSFYAFGVCLHKTPFAKILTCSVRKIFFIIN